MKPASPVKAASPEKPASPVTPVSPVKPSEPVELAPTEEAGTSVGLGGYGTGARRVLEHLKLVGDASAEDLAGATGVTVSAVRQVLRPLEDAGLIAHRDDRSRPGRPRRHYCLAPAAEALWPKRYGQLTNQLLGYIGESDPELVDAAFARRGEERVARAETRLEGRSFDDRVRELATILDEDGYLADYEEIDGGWRITEHNCAILDVAQRYGGACASEIAFLRRVLPGARVERVSHMIAGAHACAYEIVPA